MGEMETPKPVEEFDPRDRETINHIDAVLIDSNDPALAEAILEVLNEQHPEDHE